MVNTASDPYAEIHKAQTFFLSFCTVSEREFEKGSVITRETFEKPDGTRDEENSVSMCVKICIHDTA